MKSAIRKLALALTFGMMSAHALADGIRLGTPGYGGTGCPSGSASITLSPDEQSLSVIFDSFLLEAGPFKRLDRKSCNIAIPVHVPQGFSVSIFKADYRGFTSVPRGGRAIFAAEYFFAGGQGPKISRTFLGPKDSEYLVENKLLVTAEVWSACGADVNLRVNASLTLQTNSRGDDALATLDSADFSSGIIYHLKWKRCR